MRHEKRYRCFWRPGAGFDVFGHPRPFASGGFLHEIRSRSRYVKHSAVEYDSCLFEQPIGIRQVTDSLEMHNGVHHPFDSMGIVNER